MKDLKGSEKFLKILDQTKKYLEFVENQWNKNFSFTFALMKELTGFSFKKNFIVYITHPSLKNGIYLGKNKIGWGHHEDIPNYSTIYLWHEILHSYLSFSNLDHALIQLLTDNELRIRLNGGKYPPFLGHEYLKPLMKKILPYWKKYLKSKKKDILKFKNYLKRTLKKKGGI